MGGDGRVRAKSAELALPKFPHQLMLTHAWLACLLDSDSDETALLFVTHLGAHIHVLLEFKFQEAVGGKRVRAIKTAHVRSGQTVLEAATALGNATAWM